ncbi:MAG TPA: T9SS type A sorting domain-containing protein [Bacteroidales bacterium]|nr:T9SS type A sorting domain-containing protein [Bacteroidales bacterium]
MKKALLLFFSLCLVTIVIARDPGKSGIYKATALPISAGMRVINELPSFNAPTRVPNQLDQTLDIQKTSFSSSLNVNGIYYYDQRFLTILPAANMFTFGNRAGGAYGNTGNDLKYKYTTDMGLNWDSAVIASAGLNLRYPSMVTYNPGSTTNPHDMFGIFTGGITDGTNWVSNYAGSIKLDGTNENQVVTNYLANTWQNLMNIGLYCSPDGHATVASPIFNGTSTNSTYGGFNILNGVFNTGTQKVDWDPFLTLKPLLKAAGRTDAPGFAWSIDGSVGYFVFTAIDSSLTYNPYGVEWPVIYKSTDHGLTWVKEPAFDFSTIGNLHGKLFSTMADTSVVIPRWYNKWASDYNEGDNGIVVDMHGNLHIFSLLQSTLSLNADSLSYFYTAEPKQLFDVYMTQYGWNAVYVDTLKSLDSPDPGTYGIKWDHQTQMSRTPDGSKVFCVWTDTDPLFSTNNLNPDIKAIGFDVNTYYISQVKDFTTLGAFWGDNFWLRIATDVFYDAGSLTSTLPITTSIPGPTSSDPLTHQFATGITFTDGEISIPVGIASQSAKNDFSQVSDIYPNPVKGNAVIPISISKSSSVEVTISSITGQQVKVVNYGYMSDGQHKLNINSENMTAGVYFCKVTINGKSVTKKLIVN